MHVAMKSASVQNSDDIYGVRSAANWPDSIGLPALAGLCAPEAFACACAKVVLG